MARGQTGAPVPVRGRRSPSGWVSASPSVPMRARSTRPGASPPALQQSRTGPSCACTASIVGAPRVRGVSSAWHPVLPGTLGALVEMACGGRSCATPDGRPQNLVQRRPAARTTPAVHHSLTDGHRAGWTICASDRDRGSCRASTTPHSLSPFRGQGTRRRFGDPRDPAPRLPPPGLLLARRSCGCPRATGAIKPPTLTVAGAVDAPHSVACLREAGEVAREGEHR